MYIDFKITTWERAKINEKDKEVVLNAIKNNQLHNEADFANLYLDSNWEQLYDTSENVSPTENYEFATMEVYNDKDEIIHANGKY